MKLSTIELKDLKPAPVNVRERGAKDIANLLVSIRAQGLLQPLLVRPNCEGYEVVAGQRRLAALKKLAETDDGESDIPCLVMDAGDDAKAIEASLSENLTRLPMDEIDQFKAFAALVKQGLEVEDIAARFGVTERLVRQRLAIANLIAPILKAYQKDEIHPQTLRILAMATKSQQKDWWALYKSDDAHAPDGYRLKDWLFGGAQIQTDAALFDVQEYGGALISDLFGEEVYFDDPAKFWTLQNAAIAKARDAYLEDGWEVVEVLDVGARFCSWEYVDTTKEEGGKIYIVPASNGEVTFYEGQLPPKEAQRKRNLGNEAEAPKPKAEITKAMQNYLDLHRHAAVRASLLEHGDIALRLAVAQIIAGSALWSIHADPQRAANEDIAGNLAGSKSEERFQEARQNIRRLLGLEEDENDTLVRRKDVYGKPHDLHVIFAQLLSLDDDQVREVLTFVIAETLPSGSAMVEVLGKLFGTDPGDCWDADDTFLELMRDKEAINAMLGELAGKHVADGNISETSKVQKKVIKNCLNGSRTPEQTEWLPRYMKFPMGSYTERGGIRAIEDWDAVQDHYG